MSLNRGAIVKGLFDLPYKYSLESPSCVRLLGEQTNRQQVFGFLQEHM